MMIYKPLCYSRPFINIEKVYKTLAENRGLGKYY